MNARQFVQRSTILAQSAFGEIITIRWQPGRDTLVAIGSYGLVVAGLLTAFQVFTTQQVAANFITFGPITLAGLGVALPIFYTVLVRRRPLADVGLTARYLWPSLLLSLVLGLQTFA